MKRVFAVIIALCYTLATSTLAHYFCVVDHHNNVETTDCCDEKQEDCYTHCVWIFSAATFQKDVFPSDFVAIITTPVLNFRGRKIEYIKDPIVYEEILLAEDPRQYAYIWVVKMLE